LTCNVALDIVELVFDDGEGEGETCIKVGSFGGGDIASVGDSGVLRISSCGYLYVSSIVSFDFSSCSLDGMGGLKDSESGAEGDGEIVEVLALI
jgi:hypothetical protein